MGKSKKKQKVAPRPETGAMDIVVSVAAVVLMAGLRTVAAPCLAEDGASHACATTGRVLSILSFVALVLAVMRLLSADRRTKRSFDLFLLVVGVLVAILPGTVLALCGDAAMRCRSVMLPFCRAMGVVLALCALACEATTDREQPTGRKRRR